MSSRVSILILFESFICSAIKSVRGEYVKIFEKKEFFFFFAFGYSLYELFSFMTLFAIFDRNLMIFFEKTLKNQFSGRNQDFDEKPSDTNLNLNYF